MGGVNTGRHAPQRHLYFSNKFELTFSNLDRTAFKVAKPKCMVNTKAVANNIHKSLNDKE